MSGTPSRPTRPRPRARVLIDPHNAYARLGISPLTPTDEIARILRERRSELLRQARARGESGEETAAVVDLQAIERDIGDPRARAAYDLAHPQNELLTVQPAAGDRWLEPRGRADLATAWLRESLPPDDALASAALVALPHPECLALWAPSPELLQALAPFVAQPAAASPGANAPRAGEAQLLTVADLSAAGPTGAPRAPTAGNERDNEKP